jgi:uncharacterized damage-inducible protein DinB
VVGDRPDGCTAQEYNFQSSRAKGAMAFRQQPAISIQLQLAHLLFADSPVDIESEYFMEKLPEPWLRGTLTNIAPVQRAVLHALELAKEDIQRWCGDLTDEQVNARPGGVAPVAFHIRHIARSSDRLLTYAEGGSLTPEQITVMKAELEPGATRREVFAELDAALERSVARVEAFSVESLSMPRVVGRQQMPTTVAGLLVHVADHAQRHVGQAIVTAKIAKASST